MVLPLPPRVDPQFARIASKLSVLELMAGRDEDNLDVGMEKDKRGETRFLNFYSADGIRYAMEAYGFNERLAALGLTPNEVVITREDAFHHRMEIFVEGGRDNDHRIMDLRVHLRHVAVPGDEEEDRGRRTFGVMVIEWLSMQNPKGAFTAARPQLPGQAHPGTGLGRAVHNILMVIAQRLGRDAILNVPEHFHLARLYQAIGYRYPTARMDRELATVVDALGDLHFAVAAWAVERGCVRVRDQEGERVWQYRPVEMMLPLTSSLRVVLSGIADWVAERLFVPAELEVSVDMERLRRSLKDDPVLGIDPNDLEA